MPKKLTYEFVKSEFEKEGYELLSKEYKGAHSKLNYICPEKHNYYISWTSWASGRRCYYCGGKASKTIEEVRDEFEKIGYKLLATSYVNSNQRLKYVCSHGKERFISRSNLISGQRCACFRNERAAETLRFSYNELYKRFIGGGFKPDPLGLLNYRNSRDKVKCRCLICGETTYKSLDKLVNGCQKCWEKRRLGKGHWNWQGGISKLPYCPNWTKEYKNDIKERDNYQCLNPYCYNTNNKLVVHHIDYTKTICGPDNLITLCSSCNVRANKDREWHTQWYRAILNKRYGYKY